MACPLGEHGWYFRKMWRPDRGRVEVADPTWLRLEPFWQHLCGGPYRVAIIDVPHAPPAPPPGFPGIYLSGWQCHDYAPPAATPQELWRELEVRFGRPRLTAERYGRQTERAFLSYARRSSRAPIRSAKSPPGCSNVSAAISS